MTSFAGTNIGNGLYQIAVADPNGQEIINIRWEFRGGQWAQTANIRDGYAESTDTTTPEQMRNIALLFGATPAGWEEPATS